MVTRALVAAAAAASALVFLAGCATQASAPAPPTRAEVVAYNQTLLDGTRGTQGLEGVVPRLTTSTTLPKSSGAWVDSVLGCLADAGFPDTGFSSSSDGYSFGTSDRASVRARIALYYCVAQHPGDPVATGDLYSAAQLHYLWSYFSDWQIPCLRLNGFAVSNRPSRSDFLDHPESPLWTPYAAANAQRDEQTLTDESDRVMMKFEILCGPSLGVITRKG